MLPMYNFDSIFIFPYSEVANVLLDRAEWKCVLRNGSFDGTGALMSPMGKMIETMPGTVSERIPLSYPLAVHDFQKTRRI